MTGRRNSTITFVKCPSHFSNCNHGCYWHAFNHGWGTKAYTNGAPLQIQLHDEITAGRKWWRFYRLMANAIDNEIKRFSRFRGHFAILLWCFTETLTWRSRVPRTIAFIVWKQYVGVHCHKTEKPCVHCNDHLFGFRIVHVFQVSCNITQCPETSIHNELGKTECGFNDENIGAWSQKISKNDYNPFSKTSGKANKTNIRTKWSGRDNDGHTGKDKEC